MTSNTKIIIEDKYSECIKDQIPIMDIPKISSIKTRKARRRLYYKS